MTVARWINMMCGALLFFAALVALGFLPGELVDYAREPEDVWLGGFLTTLLGLVAALCFANAWPSNARFGWRILANLGVIVALAVLLILGRDDPTVPPLLALCALGPVTALIGTWRQHS